MEKSYKRQQKGQQFSINIGLRNPFSLPVSFFTLYFPFLLNISIIEAVINIIMILLALFQNQCLDLLSVKNISIFSISPNLLPYSLILIIHSYNLHVETFFHGLMKIRQMIVFFRDFFGFMWGFTLCPSQAVFFRPRGLFKIPKEKNSIYKVI